MRFLCGTWAYLLYHRREAARDAVLRREEILQSSSVTASAAGVARALAGWHRVARWHRSSRTPKRAWHLQGSGSGSLTTPKEPAKREGITFRGLTTRAPKRPSLTGPRGSVFEGDDAVASRLDDLESSLHSGMKRVDQRIAATEEVLKLRVTQMELAGDRRPQGRRGRGLGQRRDGGSCAPSTGTRRERRRGDGDASPGAKGALLDRASETGPFTSPRGGSRRPAR